MDCRKPPLVQIIKEELIGNIVRSRTYYPSYARSLGFSGFERVIEFGSGGGLLSRPLARILQPDGSLTCIESSQYWMTKAQSRLHAFPNIAFLCGDVTRQNLPQDHFDAVVIHFALGRVEVPEQIDVISALARALRPEGRLYIREPMSPGGGIELDTIRTLMTDAGLREQHATSIRTWFYRTISDGIFVKSW
jgi:tRNA A58 N-methylase Trm61